LSYAPVASTVNLRAPAGMSSRHKSRRIHARFRRRFQTAVYHRPFRGGFRRRFFSPNRPGMI